MRVAPESAEQEADLLMHHRVIGDGVIELRHLLWRRQFAVKQQVTDLEKVGVLGQLIDRIPAVQKDPLVAVDIGEIALTGGGGSETGVVGKKIGVAVELADVDHVRPFGSTQNR